VKKLHRPDTSATTRGLNWEKLEHNRRWQTGKIQTKPRRQEPAQIQVPMKSNERRSVGPTNPSRRELDQQFLRCQGMLKQIAEQVLDGTEEVEEAMRRSYAAAGSHRHRFGCDGEFRRWLVRSVLHEALTILREKENLEGSSTLVFLRVC